MGQMLVLGPLARTFRTAAVLGVVGLAAYIALPSLRELAPVSPPEAPKASAVRTPAPAVGVVIQPQANGTVRVALTDAQLTALAAPYFPQSALGFTVSDPKVNAASGKLVLNAKAQSFLGTGALVATATPTVNDGRLVVRIDSVTLGSMAVPQAVSDQFASQLQAAIDSAIGPRLRVTTVSAESGVLTVSAVPLS